MLSVPRGIPIFLNNFTKKNDENKISLQNSSLTYFTLCLNYIWSHVVLTMLLLNRAIKKAVVAIRPLAINLQSDSNAKISGN